MRATISRLARLRVGLDEITAILITHEHADHIGGVGSVARRWSLPVWMTAGTYAAAESTLGVLPQVNLINPHERLAIGDIEVAPFPVPHDAREPSQFIFSDGAVRLGFLTDAGSITAHMEKVLSACQALVLECNHDREMLANGEYPAFLKARVAGPHGHLDNATAAGVLGRLDTSRLQHVVAAHLSQKNNTQGAARAALADALACEPEWIQIADQDQGLSWRDVRP